MTLATESLCKLQRNMTEKAHLRLPPDNDRGPMLLAITWTTAAVATVIVILRVYSRTVLQNAIGWDDAAIIAALVGITLFWPLSFFLGFR